MSDRHYLDQLADFACAARWEQLPPAVQQRCRWIVADCLGVMAVGMQAPEMRSLVARHVPRNGSDTAPAALASVIGAGRRAAMPDAAFLNGCAGTWVELDEGNTSSKGHPGIQIVPAVLAYAQQHTVSGRALLTALAVGYELSARINLAAQVRPSVHPHGTFGVIGAAIAIGKLAGVDAPAMRRLINVAATMGMTASYATLRDGATVRNVYTGHSAYMGLMAVRLVQAGFTGETDGVASVYGAVLSDGFSPEQVVSGLGEHWLVAGGYFKLYPTARSVHSAIDALQAALARHPAGAIPVASIERVRVRTYRLAAVKNNPVVNSGFGAKFSIPFALATLLHHGHGGLAAFTDEAVQLAEVRSLARRIEVTEDSAYSALYPERQHCDVIIYLRTGEVISGHCEIMKGEPGRPNTEDEIRQKFTELADSVWGQATAQRLWQDCQHLEALDDVGVWVDCLPD